MMDLWLFSGMKLRTKFDTIPINFIIRKIVKRLNIDFVIDIKKTAS